MSVSFSETVRVIKYNETAHETIGKTRAHEQVKKTKDINSNNLFTIKKILYTQLPTQKEYINANTKNCQECLTSPLYSSGKKSRCIKCFQKSRQTIKWLKYCKSTRENKIIYSHKGKKIRYNLHRNTKDVICIKIITENLFNCCVFKNKFIDTTKYKSPRKAEYIAKIFIIDEIKKIFENNNIM